MKTKTTPKGTELPLMQIHGKDYLQVAHRLVWYREECPTGHIHTTIHTLTPDYCVVTAMVTDKDGKVLATGHKMETAKGYPDYVEKAETGAIGRALGAAGYGTQFEPSFEEGERLADAPTVVPIKVLPKKSAEPPATPRGEASGSVVKLGDGNNNAKLEKSKPDSKQVTAAGSKEIVLQAFGVLKAQGKTDSAKFKKEVLGGKSFTSITEDEANIIREKINQLHPELGGV